ncbi:helix-turn-helix domain-containing protein [bacterium]|nr:helix-turn-helix domain-containing protein [bacterium]
MLADDLTIRSLFDSVLWLLEQTSVPALLVDYRGKIITANTPFLSVTKFQEEELLGKRCRELEVIEDLVEIQRRKKYLKSQIGHYHGYSIIIDRDKKEFFCRLSIDKVACDSAAYYLKQFQMMNHNKIEEFKDLVKIRNTIEENLQEIRDVFVLARVVRMDYRRILFLMKEFEGVTPKRYLTGVRLRRCLELIEASSKTQKEIAFELGFCDVSHLCNVFKDSMKMTITEYLKTNCCQNG